MHDIYNVKKNTQERKVQNPFKINVNTITDTYQIDFEDIIKQDEGFYWQNITRVANINK